MKVTQLINSNGNAVKNQFVIRDDENIFFKSYDSTIAKIYPDGSISLDKKYWDYSATTLKHLKTFLEVSYSKKEIESLIESGVYTLENLN